MFVYDVYDATPYCKLYRQVFNFYRHFFRIWISNVEILWDHGRLFTIKRDCWNESRLSSHWIVEPNVSHPTGAMELYPTDRRNRWKARSASWSFSKSIPLFRIAYTPQVGPLRATDATAHGGCMAPRINHNWKKIKTESSRSMERVLWKKNICTRAMHPNKNGRLWFGSIYLRTSIIFCQTGRNQWIQISDGSPGWEIMNPVAILAAWFL